MGFHCFAVAGQMLSCPLFDCNSCNSNNTEKVVALELCVLLWFGVFLWALKNQLAHISDIPSFLYEPVSLHSVLRQSRGPKTTDESRK